MHRRADGRTAEPGGGMDGHVDRDRWFATFDERGLAFLHQQQEASGEDSTFFELVGRG